MAMAGVAVALTTRRATTMKLLPRLSTVARRQMALKPTVLWLTTLLRNLKSLPDPKTKMQKKSLMMELMNLLRQKVLCLHQV